MEQIIRTLGSGSKVLETTFDNFPTWALCYAYYGADSAGDLTAEEIAMVDAIKAEYGSMVYSDEDEYFDWFPLFGLACDVCAATFWKSL